MRTLQRMLPAIFLLVPALCHGGEESCLWMNAATAGGVLGGMVIATVSHPNTDVSNVHTANARSGAGPTSAAASAATYLKVGTDDSDCSFILQPGPVAAELRIKVRTMSDPKKEFASYTSQCRAKQTPLKALGNEAFACTLDGNAPRITDLLVGRVRDRVFIMRLSTNEPATESTVGERLRRAADIVAGNLF
jgi:hypothetical protein